MKIPYSNQRGFSLVETMVALVILAIGLVALVGLQTSALRLSQSNKKADLSKSVLVSEIEKIMTLSNLELQTSSNVGDQDTLSGLGAPYNTALFSTADTSVPAGYNYVRWRGVSRTLIRDDSVGGGGGATEHFLVKIAIDEKYLLQDVLARGQMTVYWPVSVRGLDFLETTFFTQRK
ncbi:MAG: hypothetical protein DRP47_11690 [Candidatus Zixiibacteriota bacterium]|nr:MAG: hypothetical protein DRP47_11690 [candidate division Zixibacteria bacterium]